MPFWSQMGSHREPKIAQKRPKSCSRALPESTLKKVTKNDAIWVPSRPQNIAFRTIGVSKIKKSPVPKNDLKMTSKCIPFWMLLAPKIAENLKKHTLKKNSKKCIQQLPKKEPKRDGDLARKRHQNHKNPSHGLKMCPEPPGEVPRHPKYSKIIEK